MNFDIIILYPDGVIDHDYCKTIRQAAELEQWHLDHSPEGTIVRITPMNERAHKQMNCFIYF